MGRVKTSVYVDSELWQNLKRRAYEENKDLSDLIEELIAEKILLGVEKKLESLISLDSEIDFRPIKAKSALSKLVREMRDERDQILLGQ
ncbi:MAG: hypothetical protein QFX37_06115 [Archaeoglobales archaeon]|nr:hypothetical protein [Archaeoglobales archaeon]